MWNLFEKLELGIGQINKILRKKKCVLMKKAKQPFNLFSMGGRHHQGSLA